MKTIKQNFNLPSTIGLITLILILAGTVTVYAQQTLSFQQKQKEWEALHAKVEKSLNAGYVIDEETLREYRQQLRLSRLEASTDQARLREQLKSQKDLLATLGEEPEDTESENKKIRDQRKKLDIDIALTDGELKQANLIIAKNDELLFSLDHYQKQRIKEKLLARAAMPFSITALQSLVNEFSSSIVNFDAWLKGSLVLLGVIIIILLTKPITKHLNRFSIDAPGIQLLSPFSRTRLLFVGIAAYFVFLLRFGVINLGESLALENMVHVLASVCLSVILFLALGKIHFITPENNKEDLGERRKNYNWLWNGLKRLTRLILLLLPVAAIAGYINLAQYVSFNILITIIAGFLFFMLRSGVVRLNRKLHPVKDDEELSPLAITIVEPIIALFSISFALFFWGMTSEDLETFIERYSHGITIGDITIDFMGILSAIGFFFALYYLTKLIQWFISSRVFPYTKLDHGIRDAVIAITGYIGITIALLAAMSALGLDMSNLAIVAGALSVGIGFGLQAIFNNFVSGLILLFERPVKVGDWVVVGDKQGTIKKIRVRSTEIETFWNSSVIVPNSQLISETVTNWTLHDKVGRVDVAVGVAYGSNTEQVKEVLLEVAKSHPQVRTVPAPNVYFMNFGDSSLDFELRCFIRNIRDIFLVSSELRFAVDKAFREHNIEIPFPQRDLHIKNPEALK